MENVETRFRQLYEFLKNYETKKYGESNIHGSRSKFTVSNIRLKYGQYEGYSNEEISEVMSSQNVRQLPAFYRLFLQEMGKLHGGLLFLGNAESIRGLKNLKQALLTGLTETNVSIDILPSENVFVFCNLYGDDYFFFDTNDNIEDPYTHVYFEGWEHTISLNIQFSEWIQQHVIYHKGIFGWMNEKFPPYFNRLSYDDIPF